MIVGHFLQWQFSIQITIDLCPVVIDEVSPFQIQSPIRGRIIGPDNTYPQRRRHRRRRCLHRLRIAVVVAVV
jgi:hypothetical protein